MAYTRHSWSQGPTGQTPITHSKLNEMEIGIENAASVADDGRARSLTNASSISTLQTSLSGVTTRTSTLESRATTIEGNVSQVQDTLDAVSDTATSASNNASSALSTLSTQDGRITTAEDDISSLRQDVTALQGMITGDIAVSSKIDADLFVNSAAFNSTGAWTYGVSLVARPGYTNSGNVTLSTGNSRQLMSITNAGLYAFFLAFRATGTTSNKRAFMDLYLTNSGGTSLTLIARAPGWDTNTFSLSYCAPCPAGSYYVIGHLSADTIAVPDGDNGVTAGTDVGLQVAVLRIGDI